MKTNSEIEEARARFEALSKGLYHPRRITVKEAKERLRECDPGLDIAPLLRAQDPVQMKRAGLVMLAESVDMETLSYFSPLFAEAFGTLLSLFEREEPKV